MLKGLISATLIVALVSVQLLQCPPGLAEISDPPIGDSQSKTLYAGTSTEQGLTPGGKEAATLLGILPKVDRLIELRQARGADSPISDEELGLKVDVLDRVLRGTLEVRMVSDRIDRELSWHLLAKACFREKDKRPSTICSSPTSCKAVFLVSCPARCFFTDCRSLVLIYYCSQAA